MDIAKKLIFGFCSISAITMVVFVWLAIEEANKKRSLMNACLQDHKEYVCYSMLNMARGAK